jgi:hypothetical protein
MAMEIVDLPIKMVIFQLMSWLVVWNMAFIFPYIGNYNPN